MRIAPFSLERYFARHEFTARRLLGSSDPESLSLGELLALEPDAQERLGDLWLGYTDDYRKLRYGTIGSLYHDSDFTRDVTQLNRTGQDLVFRLYNVEPRKARASARYFLDMHRTVKQCRKVLRRGGMILFVIGNTEYKAVKIDNAAYLRECLVEEGFADVETAQRKVSSKTLTPYRDTVGRFTTDETSRKVYAEEFIVTGRKS